MKRTVFISLVFIAFGLFVNGQEKPITEFDLYGCWVLEYDENGKIPKQKLLRRCEDANQKNTIFRSDFSLLAFNKSEFKVMSNHPMNCNGRMTNEIEGSWTFNEVSGIVEQFYPINYQAEFWEKVKEEYPEVEIPNPRPFRRFRIVSLDESGMEIEKLRTTMVTVAQAYN
ncbi:hypothetical protein [Maribacter stanieri]|uniref:hypothetical protein n=1 Tax=Maribacter stanieri TaxID=440514 RepID=UPI0030D8572D|tara:strand:- start:18 stop:527 length:510 start_codon:yes stop_codon:yes gene_type:complete